MTPETTAEIFISYLSDSVFLCPTDLFSFRQSDKQTLFTPSNFNPLDIYHQTDTEKIHKKGLFKCQILQKKRIKKAPII